MKTQKKLYYQFTASIMLLVFVFLGYVVKFYPNSQWLVSFDHHIISMIQQVTPLKTTFFKAITFLGSPTFDTILGIGLFILLWWKRRKIEAFYLAINMVMVAGIGNQLLKLVFQRPRPHFLRLASEGGFSFPSGHAMGSILLYGTLFIFITIWIKKRSTQWILGILLTLLVVFIGMSRIYLGVHYPSDIIGGWLVGGGYLAFTYPIFRQRIFIKEFKGEYRS